MRNLRAAAVGSNPPDNQSDPRGRANVRGSCGVILQDAPWHVARSSAKGHNFVSGNPAGTPSVHTSKVSRQSTRRFGGGVSETSQRFLAVLRCSMLKSWDSVGMEIFITTRGTPGNSREEIHPLS